MKLNGFIVFVVTLLLSLGTAFAMENMHDHDMGKSTNMKMEDHDMDDAMEMEGHDMDDHDMDDHDMDDHDMDDHGKMKGHDMGDMDFDRIGTLFHESDVNGYTLEYYLMDMREMKGHSMGNMEDKPHHIMVYIIGPKGKLVEKARVGFLIKNGKGEAQKNMAMYMSNGFGIMADMKAKGNYTITVKALIGDKKLMDRFDFEIQ